MQTPAVRRASREADAAKSVAAVSYKDQRPWIGVPQTGSSNDRIVRPSRSRPQFYIPSVLLPAEASKSQSVHKIHILGDDARSKFIAHALSSVYDSVELLGRAKDPSAKFNHILRRKAKGAVDPVLPEVLAANTSVVSPEDNSRINDLIITGKGYQAVKALESVKHRVDKDSTICFMNDGLGVLEDARQKFFNDTKSSPMLLYGHMSHRLGLNKHHNAVKEISSGKVMMSMPPIKSGKNSGLHRAVSLQEREHLLESFRKAEGLRGSFSLLDSWLRFKLPSVIFESVAEPICLMFDIPYEGIIQNPPAMFMMHKLLDEILLVVEALPEVQGSVIIRDFVRGPGPKRLLYNMLNERRKQDSELRWRVESGLPTDVKFLNGYFVSRAKKLGLNISCNTMMWNMVKSKHSIAVEKRNSYVPMEETSIPGDLGFKFRTSPRK